MRICLYEACVNQGVGNVNAFISLGNQIVVEMCVVCTELEY